ncbi:esterase/lipase family protein [Planctomyces sp. SH-PL62]|uniref:esterase/lipase family protein n=1 Tax=Planctomyces sp. SH-PL62 TaxID=1636152 RepID=UPI00078B95B2|nr:alpha/beta fold hydrolase [Planctomyces sp. SH-PL62]AMV38948.1 Alpha/beta hydrolase family protein [Planctomyces sp. SH-PL62]
MRQAAPSAASRKLLPWAWFAVVLLGATGTADRRVEIAVDAEGAVSVSRIVAALAESTAQDVRPPAADLNLPVRGLAGALGRNLLRDSLGDAVGIEFTTDSVVLLVPEALGRDDSREAWRERLDQLASRTEEASNRRTRHSLRPRPSYRPNDPARPTICLVHGLNSSSAGFVHMIPLLEEAGYGVVTFDYPDNQKLDDSCEEFRADWQAFRKSVGERRSWAILAHSMGSLVARAYIEGPGRGAGDVDSFIMIAPVNQGAHVARLQPVLQMISRLSAVRSKRTTQALAELSEGPGRSAEDMLPGSDFLKRINAAAPNEAVPYHIIAGNLGLLTAEARKRFEDQLGLVARNAGPFAVLTQVAVGEVAPILDELTDGTGDGAVTVESTRLPGAPEPVVLAANHAELIRAPLLFADPGPVVTMPWILRWLKEDHGGEPVPRAVPTPEVD